MTALLASFLAIITVSLALANCKHAPESRALLSVRPVAEIYKEVGELFEFSIVVSERALLKEDEPAEVRLQVVHNDGQVQQLERGAQVHGRVVKFTDLHLDTPCDNNCRLQAELILPQTPLEHIAKHNTTVAIPLRIVAASWALHVAREPALGFKLIVTHEGQPVAQRPATVAVCTPPCLPWGGDTGAKILLNAQSITLDDTGSWRGKLSRAAAKAMVYVKIARRILQQALPEE